MDGDGHQARQSDSSYATPQSVGQASLHQVGSSTSERYRPSNIISPQNPILVTGDRGGGIAAYGSYEGYGNSSQFTPQPIQYQTELVQNAQRQQQQHHHQQQQHQHQQRHQQQQSQPQFSSYGSGIVYNVAQQTPQQSPYQSAQQYPQRQSAAIEVLSTQFGVPQYFSSGESGTAGVAAVSQQYPSSQFQPTTFTHSSNLGRSSLPQGYNSAEMAGYGQAPASDGLAQQGYGQQEGTNYDSEYNQYQEVLRQTFDHIHKGRLVEATTSLLQISEWLLTNAVSLGLARDEVDLHAERIKMWTHFNNCWLGLFQHQKTMTERMQRTGQEVAPPQTLLSPELIKKMAKELVRMCDGMEKHGMVDYEMGVWEENIMTVLLQCLDLIESVESSGEPTVATSSQR